MIFKRGHSEEGGKMSVILRRRKEAKTGQAGEGERSRQNQGDGWLVCCQRVCTGASLGQNEAVLSAGVEWTRMRRGKRAW